VHGGYVWLMSITVIVLLLVLLVIGVAAFGMRREQAEHPAGAQTLAMLLIVVVGVLVLAYMVVQRGR
jgi:L-asparagine transporter-like permease